MVRAWFNQVDINTARARVQDVVLKDGVLLVQSTRGMIHVIDAESGKTVWSKQVGRPNLPSMPPAIGHDLVVVINGTRLYALNRYNGDLLRELPIEGVPAAGAAVSRKRAYVPVLNGPMLAYRLEPLTAPLKELGKKPRPMTPDERAAAEELRRENIRLSQEYTPPLSCHATGRPQVQPLVIRETREEERVVWFTERGVGYINIGGVNLLVEERLEVKHQLQTPLEIVARPVYLPPEPKEMNVLDPKGIKGAGIVYAAARDGFVYAVQEKTGQTMWRFSAGDPIVRDPVLIGLRLYVTTQLGGMYCLEAKTGQELWFAPQVMQFLAVSKSRVYVVDKIGRLLVLNSETGARLDSLPIAIPDLNLAISNSISDRIYLVSANGLVQCLREVENAEPLVYDEVRRLALDPDVAARRERQAEEPEVPPDAGPEPPGPPLN
jgi:hypothetical protein